MRKGNAHSSPQRLRISTQNPLKCGDIRTSGKLLNFEAFD